MRRGANVEWDVYANNVNTNWQGVQVLVLMDIRDELQRLNRLLHCSNFMEIPYRLAQIQRNTAKPKAKKVPK